MQWINNAACMPTISLQCHKTSPSPFQQQNRLLVTQLGINHCTCPTVYFPVSWKNSKCFKRTTCQLKILGETWKDPLQKPIICWNRFMGMNVCHLIRFLSGLNAVRRVVKRLKMTCPGRPSMDEKINTDQKRVSIKSLCHSRVPIKNQFCRFWTSIRTWE